MQQIPPGISTFPAPVARPFTFIGRLRSFRCAFRGVALVLASQHNAWIHAFATVAVVAAGACFRLPRFEWCWIIMATVAVWTAEALNTALEYVCDAASPQFHPLIRQAKDVAAGAVLIAAAGAVLIGMMVFGPRLLAS